MAMTAEERAKKYRDRLKQNTTKYIDFKRKDRERKAQKQALMNVKEKENYRNKHRISQQKYCQKLKEKNNNKTQPKYLELKHFLYVMILFFLFSSSYNKQTLAKAVKKVLRVSPNDQHRQHQVLKRIGEDIGLFQKPTFERTQAQIHQTIIKQVQDFYEKDPISWQAPGKRDFITIRENGTRIQYQKRHLLYNIREVYELFVQDHPGINKYFLLQRIC